MAKKKRPTPPRPPDDPHTARMAGDDAGLQPARKLRKPEPKTAEAKKAETDEAKLWESRILRANKTYDKWAEKYEVKHLDEYYEGFQWRGYADNEARKKYVINMVFATVETQLPTLMFSRPKVKCEARPEHGSTPNSQAGRRATLEEQAVQTVVDDPRVRFLFETDLSLRDAYPRFGIIEVGYSADWIDNPNAGKPLLKDDESPMLDKAGETLVQPKRLRRPGTKESVYVRRVAPECFRVMSGHNSLTSNDWAGYYDWVPLEDVQKNPAYSNTEDLKAGASVKTDPTQEDTIDTERDEDIGRKAGAVKLWKLWNLRGTPRERIVYAEGHPKLLLREAYTTFPFAALKFYERRNAFYPLPPIYNWLGPQDEINETREMQKVHRRRATRRYMAEPGVEATELEKLEQNEDMTVIRVAKTTPPPIVPIQDAPLDAQIFPELAATRDDLNQISGVMGEARNAPTAPTATQANIANERATIRESRARQQVANWLAEIARLILLTMKEKMTGSILVKRTVDPFTAASDPQALLEQAVTWEQIDSDALDLDVDVSIDVTSLSPVATEAQRVQWMNLLALMSNPAVAGQLYMPVPTAPMEPSPMFRKTLTLNGVTSDQEIREWWRVGQALRQEAMAAVASQAALSKQPEPPKVSVAFKGEDIILALGPIMGPIEIAKLLQAPNPMEAAGMAQPGNLLNEQGNGNGAAAQPMPTGGATGTPSKAPSFGG